MRLREPFNGLKLAQGHSIFHLAFFISSFMAVGVDSNWDDLWTVRINEKVIPSQAVVVIIRAAHLLSLVFRMIIYYLETNNRIISSKIFTALQIFGY